jgi:hypothetical protein
MQSDIEPGLSDLKTIDKLMKRTRGYYFEDGILEILAGVIIAGQGAVEEDLFNWSVSIFVVSALFFLTVKKLKNIRGSVKLKSLPVYFLVLTPFVLSFVSMVAFKNSPFHVTSWFLPLLFIFIAAAILTWQKRFYFYAAWSIISVGISIYLVRVGLVEAENLHDIEAIFSSCMGAVLLLGGLIVFIASQFRNKNLESPPEPSRADIEQDGIER